MASNVRLSRLSKELADLERDPRPGIICHPVDDDDITHLEAFIKGPPDSPYEKGNFKLDIKVPDDYPFSPPQMRFLTRVYHPNIDDGGRICADILKKGEHGSWRPSLNISTTLISLSGLLASPNPDDPLDAEIAREYQLDHALFLSKAREYTFKYATGKQADEDSTVQREIKQDLGPSALVAGSNSSNMEKNTDRPMSRKSKLSLSTKKRKSALSLASPSSSLPVGDAVDIESTQSSLPRTLGSSNNNNTANTQSDTTFSQQAPIVMESNNESVEANPVNNQHTEEPQSLAPVTKSQQLSQSSSRDASTQVDELSQDSTQHSIHSLEPSAQQQHPSTPWEDIDDTTSQNEIPNTPRNSSSKPNSLQQFKSASGAIDTDNADKISSVEQSRFPDMHSIKNESSQRSTKSDKSSKPSYDTTPFPSKENMDIYFEDNAKGDETQYVVCSLGKINSEQRSAPIDKDAPLYTESVSSSPSTTNTMKKPLQEVSQSSQNMVESQPSSEVTKSMSSPSSSSASGRVSFRELFKSTDDEKYMPKKRKIPASMRDKLSLSKTRKRQNP